MLKFCWLGYALVLAVATLIFPLFKISLIFLLGLSKPTALTMPR